MITKADRLYFVEPLPIPYIPDSFDDVEVLVTELQFPHHDIVPGDVVKVGSWSHDGRELWYVTTEGGRYVKGHIVNDHGHRANGYRFRIALIHDNLFAFTGSNDTSANTSREQAEIIAWSDVDLPKSLATDYGIIHRHVPAASWARDLMPRPGETQPIISAKVELAKLRWEQKLKAIKIIREGMDRGWMMYLPELREGHPNYMLTPRFDLYAKGEALIPVGRPTEEMLEEARAAAPGVELVGARRVYVPLATELMLNTNAVWEDVQTRADAFFSDKIRNKYNSYALNGTVSDSYPTIRTAV